MSTALATPDRPAGHLLDQDELLALLGAKDTALPGLKKRGLPHLVIGGRTMFEPDLVQAWVVAESRARTERATAAADQFTRDAVERLFAQWQERRGVITDSAADAVARALLPAIRRADTERPAP